MSFHSRQSIEELKSKMKKEILSLSAYRFQNVKLDNSLNKSTRKRNISSSPVKAVPLKKKFSLQKTFLNSSKMINTKSSKLLKPDPPSSLLLSIPKKRLKKKTTIQLQKSFGISSRKPSEPTSYPSMNLLPESQANKLMQKNDTQGKVIDRYRTMLQSLQDIIDEM